MAVPAPAAGHETAVRPPPAPSTTEGADHDDPFQRIIAPVPETATQYLALAHDTAVRPPRTGSKLLSEPRTTRTPAELAIAQNPGTQDTPVRLPKPAAAVVCQPCPSHVAMSPLAPTATQDTELTHDTPASERAPVADSGAGERVVARDRRGLVGLAQAGYEAQAVRESEEHRGDTAAAPPARGRRARSRITAPTVTPATPRRFMERKGSNSTPFSP